MPSDAWATGQALYSLALAGIKPAEPAIARAHAFLVATTRRRLVADDLAPDEARRRRIDEPIPITAPARLGRAGIGAAK